MKNFEFLVEKIKMKKTFKFVCFLIHFFSIKLMNLEQQLQKDFN